MTKEYSFAGVRTKALWFPYPLSPNNVTYASYYFIATPFFETFFFIQNGIPLLGYSVIMPIHRSSIPFLAHSCACTMNEYREGPRCGHFL